jgi:acyl-CoA synthetase (NDP forming)
MNMNREEDSSHTEHLDAFFHPRSVAVIGASNKKDSLGNVTFSLFYHGPFAGDVYPVSVSSEEIQGVKAYRSVRDIPGDVDLAVIVIPARAVNPVMRECVEKGIPACVIITGGFSEVGEVEREQELRTIINESDIRVIGPNCVGIYVPATGVDTVFLPKEKMGRPPAGHIGLISQSGAFVSAVLDWFAAVGLGVS